VEDHALPVSTPGRGSGEPVLIYYLPEGRNSTCPLGGTSTVVLFSAKCYSGPEPFKHGRRGLEALHGILLHVNLTFYNMVWQVLFSSPCIMSTDVHVMCM
jgi:hypothetical protein